MSNELNFEGKQVSMDVILEVIEKNDCYPVIRFENDSFEIKVLPTSHTQLADGSLTFYQNDGSLNRKSPQMSVATLYKDSLIIEIPQDQLMESQYKNSVKTFFVQSHLQSRWLAIYFPQHMTKDGSSLIGKGIAKVRKLL